MSQEGKPDFYTQKGYQMRSQHALTGAMEDYLEMICRQAEADGCARIGLLAEGLNVRPSSASKMVYQLRALGLVAFEKYGLIQPTEKGWSVGRWLLHRHEVLHRFFCMLNGSTDELELVEQVEHYLNGDTVRNLEALLERLEELDAQSLLDRMAQMEQEGTTFMNKQKQDTRRRRFVAPIVVAIVMSVLMAGLIWLFLWAFEVDPAGAPPLPVLALFVAIPAAVVVGVVIALVQRVREIERGEEDDARNY